jgi:hypothetical protein
MRSFVLAAFVAIVALALVQAGKPTLFDLTPEPLKREFPTDKAQYKIAHLPISAF